ncbi:MAG: phosphatase PAP2 family protein, partial [Candidatus Scatosoma sp.]
IRMIKPNKRILLVSAALFFLFALFTVLVATVDVAAGKVAGTKIGFSHLNLAFFDATHQSGTYNKTLYTLSDLFGKLALFTAAAFAVYGVWQLLKRKSLKKADADLYVLAATYAVLAVFYVAFEFIVINHRPVLLESGEPEASYPSSHTMLACTVFGTAVFMICRRICGNNAKVFKFLTVAVGAAFALITVLGRLFCGVHYFTDILGGVLLAAAIIALFAAFLPAQNANGTRSANATQNGERENR